MNDELVEGTMCGAEMCLWSWRVFTDLSERTHRIVRHCLYRECSQLMA